VLNLKNLSDITVIIILYNSQKVVKNCLDKFPTNQKIIFVDNYSSDNSVSAVKALRPNARIILNQENKGYGSAVNQAFSIVDTIYALLINPDAVINSSALLELYQAAENNLNAVIVAPGKGWELHLRGPNGISYDAKMIRPEGLFCTWFASGAIWLVRVNDCKILGGFDENIFLYNEDLDFCLRLRKAGKVILICPDVEAKHQESSSTLLTKEIQWRKEWNLIWGYLYITKKHFGLTKTKVEIYRLILRHLPKMIFHGLVFERRRFRRDFAIIHAVVSFIFRGQPKRS
jgi:N-acetylglucosaminyl-diphospho-decaprenol L-rhamnosyltransferase